GVGMRIDQRVAHAGLRREVDDLGEAMGSKQVAHSLAICNVQLFKPEVRKPLELPDSPLLQARIVIAIEIVDPQYVAPIRQEPARDVHSNEAGGPGDKDWICHDRSSLVSRFRSSQILAAGSDANFGIKGTLATL